MLTLRIVEKANPEREFHSGLHISLSSSDVTIGCYLRNLDSLHILNSSRLAVILTRKIVVSLHLPHSRANPL